jgi:hypothetical protein
MVDANKNQIDKEYLDQFLDETEQAKLAQFVMDEIMREAVRKVLLFDLYNCGTIKKGKVHRSHINFAFLAADNNQLSDEKLGNEVRACWKGIDMIAGAFNNMLMYKLEPMPEVKSNPAR